MQRLTFILLFFTVAVLVLCGRVNAQVYNTIEVGQATLAAYTTATATTLTPFETISFKADFPPGTTPNVFVMTPEFGTGGVGGTGDDPCTIRIDNITNTGFDAVCLEPRNENRDSISVSFDYIAIANGRTDIPTTTMGDSVRFYSACETVTAQQYGPPCSNCVGTTSYQSVTYPMGEFATTANIALLTQISSTNNGLAASTAMPPAHPTGEPEFLEANTRNITGTGFDVAIERMEAGNGTISNSEEICYLAVEDDGCKTLDLSGISGSLSTVNFEAIIGGDVVRGHDNARVVAATFAAGCFSSPPVSVSSMRRRDGSDGGFIRREGITATNVTLFIDEDRVSNSERSHITEPTSTLAFSQAFTTPVTLSKVAVSQLGRRVRFDWQTTTESFHLGFHLWGETRDGWEQLNKRLIPGHGVNTDKLSRYAKTLRLSKEQYNEVTAFGLSTVDTSGFEEFYGPFSAGEEYGEESTSEAIDWSHTRQQYNASMREKGYVWVNGRWKKLTKRRKEKRALRQHRRESDAIDLSFTEPGMHQVSLESILELMPEWRGADVETLAVTLHGRAVTRGVMSDDAQLSDDDLLVFNVASPRGSDALYLSQYVYRVLLNRRQAQAAGHINSEQPSDDVVIDYGYSEHRLTADKLYSAAMVTGSPWYDAELFALSGAVDKTYVFSLPEGKQAEHPSLLKLTVFGSLDLPGSQQDHHVQVFVNGHLVVDQWFDGLTEFSDGVQVPAGILTTGENEVVVRVPGDTGLLADIVLVDEVRILVPQALDTASRNTFTPSRYEGGFVVDTQGDTSVSVFAHTDDGDFNTVQVHQDGQQIRFSAIPFLSGADNRVELQYSVANASGLPSVATMQRVEFPEYGEFSVSERVDLMVVAHPNFIGADLADYIKFKQDLGMSVKLVNWLDLVAKFGFGNATPSALDNYLSSLGQSLRPKHALLVGGHTHDYTNLLGQGAVNFIPAHYRKVGIFQYTPSDNVYADVDKDNLPDVAFGRWPVRTQADLASIVNKSIAWQELSDGGALADKVLMIAQDNDGRNLDFEGSLEGRVVSNLNHNGGLLGVNRVYLGDLTGASPIQEAREAITSAIDEGIRLVGFAGHASNRGWGFQGIVNTSVIQNLRNVGKPTVVMPLACYTTDYQSLSTNTLAHQWLFAGLQGAVAVHGATSLGDYRNNDIFAERVLKASKTAESLGQAVLKAKREMAPVNETLDNWAFLGDPSIPAP